MLKKNKLKGFNGLLTTNAGSGDLTGGNVLDGNASLSYRSAAFNTFASYNGRYLDGYRNNFMYSRQLLPNDTTSILDQHRLGTDLNAGHTFRLGFDWTLKHNRSISFSSTGSLGRRDRTGDLWNLRLLEDVNGNSTSTGLWQRTSYDPSQQKNIDFNLNFRQNLKSNRGYFTVDAAHSMGEDHIQG
ncbi:MAG: hypothetical protein EB023_08060, partial [Flavobacteriia bacterium]|nr:hypothetical protein [Flavobacteriia bacterium]